MAVAVITGSAGLIGAEAARFFANKGLDIVGIDNDMRRQFFGEEASTAWSRRRLENELKVYRHYDIDIRDQSAVTDLFERYGASLTVIIHTAAQPSHDWAATAPLVDFSVNAGGTLNLLEAARQYSPDACFIFTSTNKVYGDTPNRLPLVEQATRWELLDDHPYGPYGIDENMSIDQTMHSLFGASKLAADVLVQEYGRYFGMKTACFRGGCLTGPGHSGTQLHGFLAYLVKCAVTDTPYVVFGYRGKQVRDNIHSFDLVNAFWHFFEVPRAGEVYNIGGGRYCNCSMLEAIEKCQRLTGRELQWSYSDVNRAGDHIWWISDIRRFQTHYPEWSMRYDMEAILCEIFDGVSDRALRSEAG
ncbi:MAG: NAD-dependent epimerase/dehydratase family protein [Alphaproteobacteria bacterium]|nr:NAD-dependent epimerase/dehydratase family protein [Alphaproteobacteria bacterium]